MAKKPKQRRTLTIIDKSASGKHKRKPKKFVHFKDWLPSFSKYHN